MACNFWHVTCYTWWGVTFSQNFSSPALMLWDWQCLEDSEQKDLLPNEWINQSNNDKGDFRTAPATPGQLIICGQHRQICTPVKYYWLIEWVPRLVVNLLICYTTSSWPFKQWSSLATWHLIANRSHRQNFLFEIIYYWFCFFSFSPKLFTDKKLTLQGLCSTCVYMLYLLGKFPPFPLWVLSNVPIFLIVETIEQLAN